MMASPFLTAEWRWLAMLSYEIDPAVLRPYVPAGTELDSFNGKTYASVVGLLFRDTRLRGVAIPGHTNFEEVNLRFYVRRTVGTETRRGVVFVKELVPKPAIAWVARWAYNENYIAVPMHHDKSKYGIERRISYEWRHGGRDDALELHTDAAAFMPAEDSMESFITEHYWGYVRQRDGKTCEYQVEHPRWRLWTARDAALCCDAGALYGPAFAPYLSAAPASAFLAEGSNVKVFAGRRI